MKTTQFWSRSWQKGREPIRRAKLYWVLILMGKQKQCGLKSGQTKKVTHSLERMDTQQKTRTRGDDTLRQIWIHHCKNQTPLRAHQQGTDCFLMQPTTKNKTRASISPQKSCSANRTGGMPHHPPAGIDTQTDTMSRTGYRMAQLHWHCRCIWTWGRGSWIWGGIRLHTGRIPMKMATRHQRRHKKVKIQLVEYRTRTLKWLASSYCG